MEKLLKQFTDNVDMLMKKIMPTTEETNYFLRWYELKGEKYIQDLQNAKIQENDIAYNNILFANDFLEGCKNITTSDIICSTIIEAVSIVHSEVNING